MSRLNPTGQKANRVDNQPKPPELDTVGRQPDATRNPAQRPERGSLSVDIAVSQSLPSSGKTRPPLWSQAYVLVLCVQFMFGSSFATFFVLPKYLIEELNAPATLVGNSHGVFAVAGVLLVPLVGRWLDRFGRKRVLYAGLLLAALTYFPFQYATSPWEVLLLRFLHGVSFTLVFNAGSALTIDMAPNLRRAEAIGYFGTAMIATNAFGPLLAESIAKHFGWARVFEACSVYVLVGLGFAVMIHAPKLSSTTSTHQRLQLTVPLLGAMMAVLAMGVGVGCSKSFVPASLVEEGALSVSPYFVAYAIGALFQRLVLGWLPDKMGRLRATVLGVGSYALSLASLAFAPTAYVPYLSVLLGMAHGLTYPASVALAVDLASGHSRGRATAWSTGFYNLGFALSSSGLAGLEPYVGYRGLVAIGAVWLCLTAFGLPRSIWWSTRRAQVRG